MNIVRLLHLCALYFFSINSTRVDVVRNSEAGSDVYAAECTGIFCGVEFQKYATHIFLW
jgi:hypothetical protein